MVHRTFWPINRTKKDLKNAEISLKVINKLQEIERRQQLMIGLVSTELL